MSTEPKSITDKINESIRADCLVILADHEEDGEDIMLEVAVAAITARHGEAGLQVKIERAVAKATGWTEQDVRDVQMTRLLLLDHLGRPRNGAGGEARGHEPAVHRRSG